MEPWGWIVAYLVGFVLVQLLLFRYVGSGRSLDGMSLGSGETSAPQSIETARAATEDRQSGSDDGEDGDGHRIRCPRCGTSNADERNYTYCRQCLGPLR